MNPQTHFYPIGTAGIPWGSGERALWLARQSKQRSYQGDVLSRLEALHSRFDWIEYGQISYETESYPLVALQSLVWNDALPVVLVTGGVHGYESSGVHGAIAFLEHSAESWACQVNLLVIPCVSPWAYERIHRWNADAIDPNRSFRSDGTAMEALALMRLIAPLSERIVLHVDLHETTDTDESEYRPALAARDGKSYEAGRIPDGFYLVGDTDKPELEFQQAVLAEVAKVTHIAPADAKGEIIGATVVAPGVILYPCKSLGLCAGMTNARFVTTTEVYPDSPRSTPEQCNQAQLAAVQAAIAYALGNRG
jgi:Succinylglutamate desuccinylase / Aspartoacylase family